MVSHAKIWLKQQGAGIGLGESPPESRLLNRFLRIARNHPLDEIASR